MRALPPTWPLVLLGLLLAVPCAPAQAPAPAPAVPLATLEVEPFAGPAPPLGGEVATNVTARVSCLLVEGLPGVPVTYSVTGPSWASATLDPATELLPTILCEDGWLVGRSVLTVRVDETAPAYAPADLLVEAVAGQGTREARANASVPVSAHYYSVVDVSLEEAIRVIAPGETAVFRVMVRNGGNGPTALRFELTEPPPTLVADVPEPFVLPSAHEAGETSHVVEVEIHAPEGSALANRVEFASYAIRTAYANDTTIEGEGSSVSLLVTVRSEAMQRLSGVPLSPVAGLAALLLAAWAFRR